MMDIVERLRNKPELTPAQYWEAQADMWHQNYKEAADEIERLRDALKIFKAYADYLDEDYGDYPDYHVSKAFGGNILVFGDFRKARAALKEGE